MFKIETLFFGCFVFLKYLDHYIETGFDLLWHDCFSVHFSHMTSRCEKMYTPMEQVLEVKRKKTLTENNKTELKDGYFTSKLGLYFVVRYFPLQT